MPPHGHSHSSHSSHSSSHHSSSHSSSSHSSQRTYTSASRSSGTSHSARPRINQPTGFSGKTITRHCRHHDYVHYNSSWVDQSTGKAYNAGYYDENGNYYRGLTVKSGDNYSSEFNCEYCGSLGKYTWTEGAVPNCENCGAPLSMVNSFAQDEEAPAIIMHDSDNMYMGAGSGTRSLGGSVASKAVIAVAGVAFLSVFGSVVSTVRGVDTNTSSSYTSYDDADESNLDLYGEDIYLIANGDGSYSISDSPNGYDKYIFFDYNNHSYYDPETDYYLWFNTDMEPALWQYWSERYSSNYGDYGWMEHENDGWWIEVNNGDWQKVPASDAGDFWWIE